MRRFASIAAITAFALAGCDSAPEPAAPAAQQSLSPAETAMTAPDGLPPYGVFRVTSADGETRIMQNIKEDGTLTNVMAGTEPVSGTWETNADGDFCLTMEGDAEASCYAQEMKDGTWTATNVANPEDAWTVSRVMGSEVLPTDNAS